MARNRLSPILNDRRIEGVVNLTREVETSRAAAVVADDLGCGIDAATWACQYWAGASYLFTPSLGSTPDAEAWASFLRGGQCDLVRTFGTEESDTLDCPTRDHDAIGPPTPLASLLGHALSDGSRIRAVGVPELEAIDPWAVAYYGIVGYLPERPSREFIEHEKFQSMFDYSDILDIEREKIRGSAEDLISRVFEKTNVMPTTVTLFGLAPQPLSVRVGVPPPVLPSDQPRGSNDGNRIIVVYEPGSTADLCLIWNLRGAYGWPYGMPLALPATADVPGTIGYWETLLKERPWSWPEPSPSALVSASIPRARLEHLARQIGDHWSARSLGDVLQPSPVPCRRSSDVVTFQDGRAQAFGWSQEDRKFFGPNKGAFPRVETRTRFRPATLALPPFEALRMGIVSNGQWSGGGYESSQFRVDEPLEILWPAGWTIVEALARDRGLRAERSVAGRAVDALVTRMGSLDEVFSITHPEVVAEVMRLAHRKGSSYFKDKVGEIARAVHSVDSSTAKLERIEALLERLSIPGSDGSDVVSVSANPGRGIPAKMFQEWLAWAESAGIVVRGVEVQCPDCGHKQWDPVAEIRVPATCRGCAQSIRYPFPLHGITFKYRASETLLRVVEHDALGHLLALHWFTRLFHVGFGRIERLYGSYPGVEFFDERDTCVGEADLLLIFSDGSVAIGEYKRSASGLTDDELEKLERLAEAVGASWTFVATHDERSSCGPIWVDCQRVLPEAPRFALTGEHLFSFPMWALGANPFSWSEDPGVARAAGLGDPWVVGGGSLDDADALLHWSWEMTDLRLT